MIGTHGVSDVHSPYATRHAPANTGTRRSAKRKASDPNTDEAPQSKPERAVTSDLIYSHESERTAPGAVQSPSARALLRETLQRELVQSALVVAGDLEAEREGNVAFTSALYRRYITSGLQLLSTRHISPYQQQAIRGALVASIVMHIPTGQDLRRHAGLARDALVAMRNGGVRLDPAEFEHVLGLLGENSVNFWLGEAKLPRVHMHLLKALRDQIKPVRWVGVVEPGSA